MNYSDVCGKTNRNTTMTFEKSLVYVPLNYYEINFEINLHRYDSGYKVLRGQVMFSSIFEDLSLGSYRLKDSAPIYGYRGLR